MGERTWLTDPNGNRCSVEYWGSLARDHAGHNRGKRSGNCKLPYEEFAAIREARRTGESWAAISKRYSVTPCSLARLIRRDDARISLRALAEAGYAPLSSYIGEAANG